MSLPTPPAGATYVNTAFGPLAIPAHDSIILPTLRRTGVWAPQETLVLSGMIRPGDTVLDIGAHVGYMAVAMSHLAGPDGLIVAFEPNPANIELLHSNTQRLAASPVQVVPSACWSVAGDAQMALCVIDGANTGDNRAYAHPAAAPEALVDITRVTLDDICDELGSVDIIKLDVQGTEAHAMRGAGRMLSEHRPLILTEFWPQGTMEAGEDPAMVLDMYRFYGYEIRIMGRVAARGRLTNDTILDLAYGSPDGDLELLLIPQD